MVYLVAFFDNFLPDGTVTFTNSIGDSVQTSMIGALPAIINLLKVAWGPLFGIVALELSYISAEEQLVSAP